VGPTRRKAITCTQDGRNTDIHALNGIQTHDPRVQANEDRAFLDTYTNIFKNKIFSGYSFVTYINFKVISKTENVEFRFDS
jgi:hypothetical protein